MVKAAERYDMYWQDKRMSQCQDADFVKLAQMLWDENIKSVQFRYPDCAESLENAPGPIGEDFKITYKDADTLYGNYSGWTVIRACGEYAYQSCEHPGWDTSEAKRFIENLQDCAIWKLMPDDVPATPQPMNHNAVRLSKI